MCTGCEVFVKIQKKWGGRVERGVQVKGGGGGEVRVDVNGEVKFL